MEKFTKLGLSKDITDVLAKMGFKEPSEIQEKTIPSAMEGKDIIGGSETGSGKTLAFASPIIEHLRPNGNVQALILTPTRELAEQVAISIRNFGKNKNLNVLAVYGGVKIEPQMRKLSSTDILVGTPGRILDHLNRRTLHLNNIKFLVLDEVDRMFDMGFSRDVERILAECPKERQTMMFSATISADMDYLAKKYTNHPVEVSLKSQVDPTKLKQVYYDVPDNKKFSLLVNLLKQEKSDLVMVFCSTRRNVDFISDNLIASGIKAKAIHGGIDQKKRMKVIEDFHKRGGILVCTDVAARGLDIKGVTHVYNYDIPSDPVDYIHRIGRTARAGEDGKAITILASRDYEKFGDLMQHEKIKIKPKELPKLEIVRIRTSFGNDRSRGRMDRRSREGFSPRGRTGPRSSGGRYNSRGRDNSRSRDNSRGRYGSDNRSRGRNDYSKNPRSSGGRYSNNSGNSNVNRGRSNNKSSSDGGRGRNDSRRRSNGGERPRGRSSPRGRDNSRSRNNSRERAPRRNDYSKSPRSSGGGFKRRY